MSHSLSSSVFGATIACAVVAGAGVTGGAVQSTTRTVHVSVTEKSGAIVADLTAAEFEVKEGGRTREIVNVRPAAAPLRVALLVADGGTGAFQLGIKSFVEKLLGHGEFAFISVVVQPEKLIDYSANVDQLRAGILGVGVRARQAASGQLMEAIRDTTKDVRRESARPVIVVMRTGREAPTSLSGNEVREALRKSGAILYAVSTMEAQRAAPSQAAGATDAVSQQRAQMADSEVTESALNLALVLGDGARDSGGRHEQVVATTMVKVMEQIADELLHQYEITYALPAGQKPSDRISVSSKRKGVTVRAPTRVPG